ncbi:ParA family protein [Duffyella gerundensis]|uniref:ParA family protein n=1 Tax=Duffyella gerundensis TaxID=1619313 RepID=UPI001AE58016|nr:ParA family protein [Duffyella gerundensis]QTO56071.1 ParA family protein [Duffyella gerundensis]
MILTIVNTKGGVGKSTLAVNIAIARAHQGKKVWLVEGDKQGSSQTAILIWSEANVQPG